VNFYLKDELIILDIEDDGLGFNIKKTKKGIGFKNMRNRIEQLKGTLSIQSYSNRGTKVSASIKL
jgi:signal transduction histidine kinase